MQNIRMAFPLYIVREDCARDLAAVLKKLAAIGFDGVEFLGFFGHSAKEVKKMLQDNRLTALGNHVPFKELTADPEGILDFHKEIDRLPVGIRIIHAELSGAVYLKPDAE